MKKYSLYKNDVHLYDFDSIAACAKWLENLIGGSLKEGLYSLRDQAWTPSERSKLFGYTIETNIEDDSY